MRELVLNCLRAQAEALSDALFGAGALSVSIEDADSDTQDEQALFGEPGTEPGIQAWQRNRVVALLPDGADPRQVIEQVRACGAQACADDQWHVQEVPDEDWVRLTQAQFGPIQISERIWIVPSWHRDDPAVPRVAVGKTSTDASDASIRIELDPGLAFGTGSHATTRLCLEWLAANLRTGASVLDYGCGSGILAIAAKMLGAGPTWAVDIDEQAVQSTRYNAQVNHVALDALLPHELPAGQMGLVLANILSNPLKVLAPMLSNRVASGGWLVLSGVLERQADEVARAYSPWLPMRVWRAQAGWVCLHGQRI
jgi:ribosomal protein L11 methyltransferase